MWHLNIIHSLSHYGVFLLLNHTVYNLSGHAFRYYYLLLNVTAAYCSYSSSFDRRVNFQLSLSFDQIMRAANSLRYLGEKWQWRKSKIQNWLQLSWLSANKITMTASRNINSHGHQSSYHHNHCRRGVLRHHHHCITVSPQRNVMHTQATINIVYLPPLPPYRNALVVSSSSCVSKTHPTISPLQIDSGFTACLEIGLPTCKMVM